MDMQAAGSLHRLGNHAKRYLICCSLVMLLKGHTALIIILQSTALSFPIFLRGGVLGLFFIFLLYCHYSEAKKCKHKRTTLCSRPQWQTSPSAETIKCMSAICMGCPKNDIAIRQSGRLSLSGSEEQIICR